ncbi:hypothetical protein K449DRAFT_412688 [Hypoxylon sp. EC38]|nr:hypothetical protein K449DRAFT_412688 [Hypoxylon sp. EC38]
MQKLKNKISELSTHHRDGNSHNRGGASVIELLQDEVISFLSVAEASSAFANRFEIFDKCKVLLIGDASHGTSEFYAARAEITKNVIEKHGFNIVAIEADWPDAEAVDRYVRHRGGLAKQAQRDVRDTNSVGLYGLNLYSLRASVRAVIDYLEQIRYSKFMLWAEDPKEYGLETLVSAFKGYETERVVKDAEQYYKMMYYGHRESCNLRDTHMFETLSAKAVVWAHNSHLGDARASSKGWSRSELNIGQLCKETFGDRGALAIGCSTYQGIVAAAERWDQDMRTMQIQPTLSGSYEQLMHATGIKNFVLDLREGHCSKELIEALKEQRLERFIGVIYRPDTERQSHYSYTVLPEQFDGLIWFDETRHVGTLEVHQPPTALGADETWPFGLYEIK